MTDPVRQPSLAAALAAFQSELPPVAKTKTANVKGETPKGVPFNYQYKYADLADVSETVMPLLGKHGLSFTCQPTIRDDGRFGLAYQLLHESGELIDGWFPLDATKKMQTIGGDITYARRYCLSAVIGVAAEEDTDAQGSDEKQEQPTGRPRRESPPRRPAGELPKNADGSVSRSRTSDDELAATGQMTDAQIREHGRLEREVKGTGPQGTERLTATPDDDAWYVEVDTRRPVPPYGSKERGEWNAAHPEDERSQVPGSGGNDDPRPVPVRTPRAAQPVDKRIIMHFDRFGITDRQVRLGYTALLAGRESLGSTKELTAVEGLAVEKALARCKDREAFDQLLDGRDATDADI